MSGTIIVMLIWVGSGNGGAATVQGFKSLAACERAIPAVMAPVWKGPFMASGASGATCVEMRAE